MRESLGESILLRATISHKVAFGGTNGHCDRLCRNWTAYLLRTKKGSYNLEFERKGKVCKHILPEPGGCFIGRQSRNTLVIWGVAIGEVEAEQLILRFRFYADVKTWETKLRKALKVYTFPITITQQQLYERGKYLIHITRDSVALSRCEGGKHVTKYLESLATSSVELTLSSVWLAHLEVRTDKGAVDRISFTSNDTQTIKDHISLFKQRRKSSSASSKSANEVVPNSCSSPVHDLSDPWRTNGSSSSSLKSGSTFADEKVYPYVRLIGSEEEAEEDPTYSSKPTLAYQPSITKPDKTADMSHSKSPMLYTLLSGSDAPKQSGGSSRYENFSSLSGNESDDNVAKYVSCRSLSHAQEEGAAPPVPPRPRKIGGGERKKANAWLYLFGSRSISADMWTLTVLLTRCEDEATFRRIRELESSCGNELLTSCRAIVTSGDILIQISQLSDMFEELSGLEQSVTFGDIDSLSPTAWIILEFSFMCRDNTVDHFRAQLSVAPSVSSGYKEEKDRASKMTFQKISVCKVFQGNKGGSAVRGYSRNDDPDSAGRGPRLMMSLKDRIQFCQKMDLDDPRGRDWKWLAGEIGLSIEDVQIIKSRTNESPTEQLLRLMERTNNEYCDLDKLKSVVEQMQRLDVVDHVVQES